MCIGRLLKTGGLYQLGEGPDESYDLLVGKLAEEQGQCGGGRLVDAPFQLLVAAGRQVQGFRQLFLGKGIVQLELPHLADPKNKELPLVPSQRQDLPQNHTNLSVYRKILPVTTPFYHVLWDVFCRFLYRLFTFYTAAPLQQGGETGFSLVQTDLLSTPPQKGATTWKLP